MCCRVFIEGGSGNGEVVRIASKQGKSAAFFPDDSDNQIITSNLAVCFYDHCCNGPFVLGQRIQAVITGALVFLYNRFSTSL